MKRKDYENFKWYPLTDEEYWVESYESEFPGCITIVYHPDYGFYKLENCYLGWGTMAKQGDWKFIIIEKPD